MTKPSTDHRHNADDRVVLRTNLRTGNPRPYGWRVDSNPAIAFGMELHLTPTGGSVRVFVGDLFETMTWKASPGIRF